MDSVKVHFNIGQSQFDPAFGNNASSMDSFIENVRSAYDSNRLESISVSASTSLDGESTYNQQLAINRCKSLAKYIASRTGIKPSMIKQNPDAYGWGKLREMVANTPGVPSRDKIIYIIDNVPFWVFDSSGAIIDGRRKQLMELDEGRTYNWMSERFFAELRSGMAVSVTLKADPEEPAGSASPYTVYSKVGDTRASRPAAKTAEETPAEAIERITFRRLALKTNMLYYGILMPNLELEWLITPNWSFAVEGNVAWWGSYKRERSYRVALFDGELRRWIKPREPWHGMYIGLMGGAGYYDIDKGTPGHYGWGMMGGLIFGYMWPISNSFSLEAEVGAGYARLRDKEYEPVDGHHVYLRTKDINYFGPLKLKLAIAWRFLNVTKTKKVDPEL